MYASTPSVMDDASPLARRRERDNGRRVKYGVVAACLGGLAAVGTLGSMGRLPSGALSSLGAPFTLRPASDSASAKLAGDGQQYYSVRQFHKLAQADSSESQYDDNVAALKLQVEQMSKEVAQQEIENAKLQETILTMHEDAATTRELYLMTNEGSTASSFANATSEDQVIAQLEDQNGKLQSRLQEQRKKKYQLYLRINSLHEEVEELDKRVAESDRYLNVCQNTTKTHAEKAELIVATHEAMEKMAKDAIEDLNNDLAAAKGVDVDADARIENLEGRLDACIEDRKVLDIEMDELEGEMTACDEDKVSYQREIDELGDLNSAHADKTEELTAEILTLVGDVDNCDHDNTAHERCVTNLEHLMSQPWCKDPTTAPEPALTDSDSCDETLYGEAGDGYVGCQTQTRGGYSCQKWVDQSPHTHVRSDSEFINNGETMEDAQNFCRNPDGGDTIWCYTTDPETRWDYCDPLPADYFCALEDETCECDGGDVIYGRRYLDDSSDATFESALATGDYVILRADGEFKTASCDNEGMGGDPLEGEPKQCWCAPPNTVDPVEPPPCAYQLEGDGAGYRGKQTVSKSGKPCQRWSAQSPHEHHHYATDDDFRGESVVAAENFCRNPTDADGSASHHTIWCYTQDDEVRWEECEPLCDDQDIPIATPVPSPMPTPTFVDAADQTAINFAACQKACADENQCCNNDYLTQGSNQKLSCLQSCMVVKSGVSQEECLDYCPKSQCEYAINGALYPACVTCDDVPAHESSFGDAFKPAPYACAATYGTSSDGCEKGCKAGAAFYDDYVEGEGEVELAPAPQPVPTPTAAEAERAESHERICGTFCESRDDNSDDECGEECHAECVDTCLSAFDDCQQMCAAENQCCNNDVLQGSNQKLSCLQSCFVRLTGADDAECQEACDSTQCTREIKGITYQSCSYPGCDDVPAHEQNFGDAFKPASYECAATYGTDQASCEAGCAAGKVLEPKYADMEDVLAADPEAEFEPLVAEPPRAAPESESSSDDPNAVAFPVDADFAACQAACAEENQCCNNALDQGSNQKLSCLQACYVSMTVPNEVPDEEACLDFCTPSQCSVVVGGVEYQLCSFPGCDDVPAHEQNFGDDFKPAPYECAATYGTDQRSCEAGCKAARVLKHETITYDADSPALAPSSDSEELTPCLSQADCEARANALGLELGGAGYDFAGDFGTKGCYTYSSGTYEGKAYFGTGGERDDMEDPVADPKDRVLCVASETTVDTNAVVIQADGTLAEEFDDAYPGTSGCEVHCEGSGFSESECGAEPYCGWDEGRCWSLVGPDPCPVDTNTTLTGESSMGDAFILSDTMHHVWSNDYWGEYYGSAEYQDWESEHSSHDGYPGTSGCELSCEGFDKTEEYCNSMDYCSWDDGRCWSAVGGDSCPAHDEDIYFMDTEHHEWSNAWWDTWWYEDFNSGDYGHDYDHDDGYPGTSGCETTCEGLHITEDACVAMPYCLYDEGRCWSAVGAEECPDWGTQYELVDTEHHTWSDALWDTYWYSDDYYWNEGEEFQFDTDNTPLSHDWQWGEYDEHYYHMDYSHFDHDYDGSHFYMHQTGDGVEACYQYESGDVIEGCQCHSTCAKCGYYDWPIGDDDCITCAEGFELSPVYSDGTGYCNPPVVENAWDEENFDFSDPEITASDPEAPGGHYEDNSAYPADSAADYDNHGSDGYPGTMGCELVCEGHHITESDCNDMHFCSFDDGRCWSAVGPSECPAEGVHDFELDTTHHEWSDAWVSHHSEGGDYYVSDWWTWSDAFDDYHSQSSLGAKKMKDGLAVDAEPKPLAMKDGLSIASHRAKVAKARAHIVAAEKLRREREGAKAKAVAKHAKKVVKAEKAPLKDPNVKVQRLAKIVYAQKQKAKAAKNFMPFSSRSTTEQKLAKGAPRLAAEGALDSSAKGPQMATKKMGSAKHAAAEKGPQTAEGGALATPADPKKNKRMIIHGKDAKRPSSILRKTPKSSKRAARVRVAKRKTPVKEVLAKLAKAKAKN